MAVGNDMSVQTPLDSLLLDGYRLREADRDILSVLSKAESPHAFDSWALAAAYDHVVATRIYNRIVWGTSPADYVAFERRALESDTDGWMLDAACGSLVFTGDLFARDCRRRVVLLDHSMRMLRRARRRLEAACGRVPVSLVLLHADIVDLPFKDATFTTVSLPAALHAFDDPVVPVSQLRRVLAADGTMYITSLVRVPGRVFANAYLRGMHRGGQIAAPRSVEEVAQKLRAVDGLPDLHHWTEGSMGYFTNAGGGVALLQRMNFPQQS